MTARELVTLAGAFRVSLLGKKVNTEAIGEYPGGVAEVYALSLDRECPEIVLNVRHSTYGEMGIFEYEDISLADLTLKAGSD